MAPTTRRKGNNRKKSPNPKKKQPGGEKVKFKYNGEVITLPNKKEDLVDMLGEFIPKCKKFRLKLGQFLVTIDEQKVLIGNLCKHGGKKANSKMVDAINNITKTELFRVLKFIQNEDQADQVALKVYHWMHDGAKKLGDEHRVVWVGTYKLTIVRSLNKACSYVQGRMKEASVKYDKENDGALPSLEEIKCCAMRQIDLKSEGDVHLFEFYWKDLLRKCQVGHSVVICLTLSNTALLIIVIVAMVVGTKEWKDACFYNTILEKKTTWQPQKQLFTASTEALCVVLYNNNLENGGPILSS